MAFGQRPDIGVFYGSADAYRKRLAVRLGYVRRVGVVLYHRVQVDREPTSRSRHRPSQLVGPPRMEAVVTRFLAARRLSDRPSTLANLEFTLRRFMTFLADAAPELDSFVDVSRDHA